MSALYECKCKNCKAEFQAILENENEAFNCPACDTNDIERKESEIQIGCSGGSCSGCSGSCV